MHVSERDGTTPVVLCVHGWCQSSAYWTPTLERLTAAAGRRGIAPDLPGFGASAGDPGPYTMEAYADRLREFLDARGIDRVCLVGGSMGGVVAQYFALRHPTRLSRLLLVATGPYTADPPAALARADALEATGWSEEAVVPIIAGFFRIPPSPDIVAKLRGIARMASPSAAAAAARSNANARTLDRLAEIAVPTLIIQGRHDRARTPEHGAEMQRRIAGSRLVVLEESGHTPQLEEPEAFHEVALPFILGSS